MTSKSPYINRMFGQLLVLTILVGCGGSSGEPDYEYVGELSFIRFSMGGSALLLSVDDTEYELVLHDETELTNIREAMGGVVWVTGGTYGVNGEVRGERLVVDHIGFIERRIEKASLDPGETTADAAEPAAESPPPLTYVTRREGAGDAAKRGQTATIHYSSWLHDPAASNGRGKSFGSTHDREGPVVFRIGQEKVFAGLDQGVVGMKVGEIREVTVVPELAFGSQGLRHIVPPDTGFVYEIELLELSESP